MEICAWANVDQIVDKRSSTLSNDYYYGCEKVIPVKATHSTLPTFDSGKQEKQLQAYKEDLIDILRNANFKRSGYGMVSRTIHAECHQFYERTRNGRQKVV